MTGNIFFERERLWKAEKQRQRITGKNICMSIPEEDYSRIGFEQLMEGCQDMRSFFISKLGLEEIY